MRGMKQTVEMTKSGKGAIIILTESPETVAERQAKLNADVEAELKAIGLRRRRRLTVA